MWYAIVRKSDSSLYSIGTILADPMPNEFEVIPLGENFLIENKQWDPNTKTFVADFNYKKIIQAAKELPFINKLTSSEIQILVSFLEKVIYRMEEILNK